MIQHTLKLVKTTDHDGIWFNVYYNGTNICYKRNESDAREFYENYKIFIKNGGQLKEVLEEITITEDNKSINQNLTNQNVEIIQTNLSH